MKKKQRRWTWARGKCFSKKLAFPLSEETYLALVSLPCYYCDNKLGNVQIENGMGLDRIDNARGYEKDNVLPCCGICNRARNIDFTVPEAKLMIQAVLKYRSI